MKKIILVSFFVLIFTLSGCDSSVTSDNGYDITELDQCIDDMVDEVSSSGCLSRSDLIEVYTKAYEVSFDPTNANYSDSDFEFSSNRTSDEIRLRYWFQYSGLDRTQESNNYDTYKDIIQTMLVDLNNMNEHPNYWIEGEFFHSDGYHFIFETGLNEELTGEVQIYDTQVTFEVAAASLQAFIDALDIDQELEKQTFQLMTEDHSVIIVVDVVNSTYQYKIFRSNNEDTNTITEVETMVESTFNDQALSLEPWTID